MRTRTRTSSVGSLLSPTWCVAILLCSRKDAKQQRSRRQAADQSYSHRPERPVHGKLDQRSSTGRLGECGSLGEVSGIRSTIRETYSSGSGLSSEASRHPDRGRRACASSRLIGLEEDVPPTGLEALVSQEKERKTWPRGEVCPLDVRKVDIVPGGTAPFGVVGTSPEVREAMSNLGAKVIHRDGERRFRQSGVRRTKIR